MRRTLLCGASTMAAALMLNSFTSTAHAADAGSQDATQQATVSVGEVVVVAEKREQKLESVAVAVSAYSSKQRDLLGISSVQDMTNFTPGLSYTTINNRPYMRGVGRQTDNLATESGVAVYVDGVYGGANASTILQSDTLFVDQIEVLRGPQSTLYGRNADGGAINYVSKRPTHDFQAEVRGGVSNYDKYFVEGAISGPINDHVRFRLGGNYSWQTGGYYHNLNGPPEGGSIAQGGNGHSYHIEGQLTGDFGDKWDWWAKLATSDYHVTYHTQTQIGPLDTREFYNSLFPNQNFGLCALPGGSAGLGCAGAPDTIVPGSVVTLANTIATNPSALNIRTFDADQKSSADQRANLQAAGSLTYHGSGFDVKYLFGYQKFYYDLEAPWLNSDGLSSAVQSYQLAGPSSANAACLALYASNPAGCTQNLTVDPAHTKFSFIEDEQFFSHEFNISSTGSGPLQWIGGLYWYHENYDQPVFISDPSQAQVASPVSIVGLLPLLGVPGTPSLIAAAPNPGSVSYYTDTRLKEDSYAAFGQADWQVNKQLKFTFGLRYNDDHKVGVESYRVVLFNAEALGLGVNTFGANTPAIDATSCPAQPTGGYPGAGACTFDPTTGRISRPLDATWHALTGTAGVSWTPQEGTLAYFKYSRGYKTGGFNSGTIAAYPETLPETVDAYELGLKQVFGHTLQVNAAAFYYNYYNDQQPLGSFDAASGNIITTVFNIPLVHTYGFELEGVWQPIDPLTISLNYAYLSAKIASTGGNCFQDTSDPNALEPGVNTSGCTVPGTQNLTGAILPEAPRNKLSLNAVYTLRFEPGSLALSGTYTWRDSEYDSVFNRSYNRAPAYSLLNLRAVWTDKDNRYSVIGFIDNVTNKVAFDQAHGLAVTDPGVGQVVDTEASLIEPRTYGLEFQYRFR